MKKTAIVSCYNQKNYGSVIQALATQMALDKIGVENETINMSGFGAEIKKRKIKYFIKAAVTSDILLSKFGMAKNVVIKKFSKNKYASNSTIRNKKFDEFVNRSFKLSNPYPDFNSLSKACTKNYSAVLVGSDQLWLPVNIAADYYTLNWVPDGINTIAYATSFGQSSLPKGTADKARVFLNRIKHIGVREESGQKLIKQIAGRTVPIVCDPTLLFTGEEWMTIQKTDPIIKEPYILVYFLGNNPPHREFVKRLKKETGYKIVALIHLDEYIKSDEDYADYTPYDIDAGDYLNLIRNALYVCTDSFHCSVFSMQYEKEFFAFRRYTRKTSISTNSRLDTLFKLAGLNNRILKGDENVSECMTRAIDYKMVQKRLETIRIHSYEFLKASILDERNSDRD